jgi:hypothetical protein
MKMEEARLRINHLRFKRTMLWLECALFVLTMAIAFIVPFPHPWPMLLMVFTVQRVVTEALNYFEFAGANGFFEPWRLWPIA